MNFNKDLLNSVMNFENGKLSSEDIKKAKSGDVSSLLSSLSKDDAKKVKDALNDKEKAKQILSSDAAKQILKMLADGKKNG